MKKTNKKLQWGATLLAIAGVALITTTIPGSARANGSNYWKCAVYASDVQGSSNASGAFTSGGSGQCGQVGARAIYKLYSGSPIYYASWRYGRTSASSTPGNIIVGGNHTATDPAPFFKINFPFST